ncbi:MAG: hypothetical protein JWM44_405 [Bacilli bacterium]|nr:hypothetical protein [Bacilli bacterium]
MMAYLPHSANLIIHIPTQTMKDQMAERTSLQPMGALFEQTQFCGRIMPEVTGQRLFFPNLEPST